MNKTIFLVTVLACTAGLASAQSTARATPPAPRTSYVHPYDDEGRPNPDAFDWTGFSVGGSIGTLGLGAESSIFLNNHLNFRVAGSLLDFSYDDTIDDIDFDLDMDFTTVRFMLDFYPSDRADFRISAGLVYADNSIGISGTPSEPEEIGDNFYSPAEIGTISGSLTFDEWSPYFGIGFGNPVRPDTAFSVSMDFGVIFTSYETEISADGTKSGDPIFQADLNDLKDDIDDDLDNFQFYPVLSFTVSYHF